MMAWISIEDLNQLVAFEAAVEDTRSRRELGLAVAADARQFIRQERRGYISLEAGLAALEAFQAQEIDLLPPATLVQRAWELAELFDRPTAYDSFYLAAAEHTGSEMWTADRRLFAAVHDAWSWVNILNC